MCDKGVEAATMTSLIRYALRTAASMPPFRTGTGPSQYGDGARRPAGCGAVLHRFYGQFSLTGSSAHSHHRLRRPSPNTDEGYHGEAALLEFARGVAPVSATDTASTVRELLDSLGPGVTDDAAILALHRLAS
ncbi:hypothetical protein DMB37_39625 [Nocardia sp. CS682]|nr:hypothetical protein DMB37_39625 [Nocardia sp. CS682]